MIQTTLRTRHEFRKRNQRLILSVRMSFLFGFPLIYLVISSLYSATPPDSTIPGDLNTLPSLQSDYNSRHLLAIPTGRDRNCTPPAIYEFPPDGFSREQRQSGWIAVHCLLSFYCFVLLAIVCDDYFVPAIEKICHVLKMSEDVAGATFMAAASSSPELFINCVGTFVTEGDLGLGTIVGSAVFNILAVPACCGLLAGQVIELDWWAVSRDSLMYGVAVISLIFTLQDGKVEWYEATVLVTAYTLYILAMYFNKGISKFARACCVKRNKALYTEVTPLLRNEKHGVLASSKSDLDGSETEIEDGEKVSENKSDLDSSTEIWKWPDLHVSAGGKIFWIITWPINFLLWLTVPDCKKYPKFFFITFFMCIVWIGSTSYMVAWLITVIGDTINIPDSVMGLTFLAAGTSVPEAVSSIIVTNQGHGSMGISSSIGSNTFDILLCLGLPWMIKSIFYPATPGEYWVNINSGGLSYSAISLLSTLLGLYISFVCNKFLLDWKIGLTCTVMYAAFLTLASLIELNVFFPVNLPTCAR